MSLTALALVACAAGLHAGWNALAKRGGDQIVFLWCATLASTVAVVPFGLWQLTQDGFPLAAVPFVVATIVVHALYFYALGRAYASGAYSLVYPVARGLGVALVPLIALLVFDERLSPVGTLGVALVVAGIATLRLLPGQEAEAPRARLGSGLLWPVLTGLTTVILLLFGEIASLSHRYATPLLVIFFLIGGVLNLFLPPLQPTA